MDNGERQRQDVRVEQRTMGPRDPALEQLRQWDARPAETCVTHDHEPVDHRGAVPQVHRAGQRGVERRLHQPQPGRHAPPHSRRARCRGDPRRDSVRAQARLRHVHPLVQPGRAHPLGGSQGGGVNDQACQASGSDARLRQDESDRPVECRLGSVLCAGPGVDGCIHGDRASVFTASGVLPPKEAELLSIAFDASYTHMYAPGTRRHIHRQR